MDEDSDRRDPSCGQNHKKIDAMKSFVNNKIITIDNALKEALWDLHRKLNT
jgi:hypothetical protein